MITISMLVIAIGINNSFRLRAERATEDKISVGYSIFNMTLLKTIIYAVVSKKTDDVITFSKSHYTLNTRIPFTSLVLYFQSEIEKRAT